MTDSDVLDGMIKFGGSGVVGAILMKSIDLFTGRKKRAAELGEMSSRIVTLGLETQAKLLEAQNRLVNEYEKRITGLKSEFQSRLEDIESDFRKRLEEERSKCDEQLTELREIVLRLEMQLNKSDE